jgi:DNA-binding MarR family transcriptional regulator
MTSGRQEEMAQLNSPAREARRIYGTPEAGPEHALVEAIDFGPLANWIGFHLRLAQSASFQAFTRATEEIHRPGHFAILMLIGKNPGISQTTLSRASGRDKSTLTPALNDLVRRGLVCRVRSKRDRRSYQLTLTPHGEAMLQRLTACAERHDRELDRIVGVREKTRFLRNLRKIISALTCE